VSKADVDVVLDQFAAVNEGDWARAMDNYADDVVLVVPGSHVKSGRFEGKQAVGEWFGDWFRNFERGYRFDIEEAREVGELIFIHATHGGRGRASGAEVSGDTTYLYRVVNGKVAYVEFHWDREEALRSLESPERPEGETH
jgi:ketosteroid isomerase-like protein